MRPTRWQLLVAVALVIGGVAYLVTRTWYDELPVPNIVALLWLALLAIAECYLAVMTRARLAGRSGTKPINPLVVARFVALAKASSFVGSLAVGGYAGFLGWVARLDTPSANRDTTTSALGVALAVLLVAAALFLERVCRVPDRDDDEEWPLADS
jgi:4-amino-4-deoxy-L-arabinose transferase-like glycosyltransferase